MGVVLAGLVADFIGAPTMLPFAETQQLILRGIEDGDIERVSLFLKPTPPHGRLTHTLRWQLSWTTRASSAHRAQTQSSRNAPSSSSGYLVCWRLRLSHASSRRRSPSALKTMIAGSGMSNCTSSPGCRRTGMPTWGLL
jgi:hypothetical protein